MTRRSFLRTAVLALGALAPVGYPLLWRPGDLRYRQPEIVRLRVGIPRLPPAFVGTTIAQISDLHFGEFVSAEELSAVVDVVLGLKPAIVAVTGDHATRLAAEGVQPLARELSRLKAPQGVFAVLGNHDFYLDGQLATETIRRADLALLVNSSVRIERQGQALYIAGVDDVLAGTPDLSRTLSGVPGDARTILLAHEPDYADLAARDLRVALQLSGHSHGGQVRAPGIGPIRRPPMAHKYPEGLRRVGSLWLYTNRGIGMVSVPIRFNCPPEVTLIELVAT